MKNTYVTVLSIVGMMCVSLFGNASETISFIHTTNDTQPSSKIAAKLWTATENDQRINVILYSPGYPDLSLASQMNTKEEKSQYVFNVLYAHTKATQNKLQHDLSAKGIAHQPLWLINGLAVKNVDRAGLIWLSNRDDVSYIEDDTAQFAQKSVEANQNASQNVNTGIEWGVQMVKAPQVWEQGFRGQGIVVANLDTGVRWDHNALKGKYRGWDETSVIHSYNWFDTTGQTPTEATDDDGHGTHTTGTILGDDGNGNQIGVAPDAKWIACRNMYGGFGHVSYYIACLQFALAPTDLMGKNPDPLKGADITSNSWGCSPSFGPGEPGCEKPTALLTATLAIRTAGVMVVASAGNDGNQGCSSVKEAPAMLNTAFSIGAITDRRILASFSSRGPSRLTGALKPDVVAPGVSVRSSTFSNQSSYGSSSGTSMAAPHVAGVTALLWSAVPGLRGRIADTEAILRETATPLTTTLESCGGISGTQVPNNSYGYGLINAQAVISRALEISNTFELAKPRAVKAGDLITLTVSVINDYNNTPLSNLAVTALLPADTSFVDASDSGTFIGQQVRWQLNRVEPQSVKRLAYVVRANRDFDWTGNSASTRYYGPFLRAYLPFLKKE
jgi:uncharacterized repeat protein (TIGR01451 family)